MKKLICILLSLIIMLSTSLTVFAEEVTPDANTPTGESTDTTGNTQPCTNHVFTVYNVTTKPTCTTNGIAHSVCDNEGCTVSVDYSIPASHQYPTEWTVVTAATCTNPGSKTANCLVCGEAATEAIPVNETAHVTVTVRENEVAATCTTKGSYEEVVSCTLCKKEISRTPKESDIIEHPYGEWEIITPATCTADGSKKRVCSVCNHEEIQTISATGHSYGEWTIVTAATCTTDGSKERVCSVCTEKETGVISKTEHNYGEWETKTPASCTADGSKERICSVCSEKDTQVIPKTGHNYGEWKTTKPATCTATGEKTRICSVCKHEETETIDKLTEHSYSNKWTVDTPATCTTDGSKSHHCTNADCDAKTDVTSIKKTGHKWSKNNPLVCSACKLEDTVTKISSATCKTAVFVGDDTSKLSFELKLKTENQGNITLTTTDVKLKKKVDSSTAGEKSYTITYGDCSKTVKITVIKPEITVKLGNTVIDDEYFEYIKKEGLTFTVDKNTNNTIEVEGHDNLKVVKKANGQYHVKPAEYYTMKPEDLEKYYVTFFFERNGTRYAKKVYLYYSTKSVKVSGKTSYVQNPNKKVKITFTETHIDGSTKTYSEYIPISTVGKKTYKSKYYSSAVPFTYYVKCKTPTVKATAGTKSVSLKWNKIDGATGYQIYRSTNKSKGFKLVKSLSGGSNVSFKNTNLKSKQPYYYRVVAVYKSNKNCNSGYTTVGCKTK